MPNGPHSGWRFMVWGMIGVIAGLFILAAIVI